MKTAASSLLLVLILTGCAAKQFVGWSSPHGDQQKTQIDQMQCQTYGAQIAPYRAAAFAPSNLVTSFLYGERVAQFEAAFLECMQARGYSPIYIER